MKKKDGSLCEDSSKLRGPPLISIDRLQSLKEEKP